MPDPFLLEGPSVLESFFRALGEVEATPFDKPTRRGVEDLLVRRAQRSQRPYSTNQMLRALLAAQTGKEVTPSRDRGGIGGFIDRGLSDLRAVAASVPHLPLMLLREPVEMYRKGPEAIAGAMEQFAEGNLGEGISRLGAAPGLRFVPGSFVAEHAFTDPQQLGRNPLITALDVAPIANELVRVKTGKRATRHALEKAVPKVERALSGRGPIPSGFTFAGKMTEMGFGKSQRAVARSTAEAQTHIAQGTISAQDAISGLIDEYEIHPATARAVEERFPAASGDEKVALYYMATMFSDAERAGLDAPTRTLLGKIEERTTEIRDEFASRGDLTLMDDPVTGRVHAWLDADLTPERVLNDRLYGREVDTDTGATRRTRVGLLDRFAEFTGVKPTDEVGFEALSDVPLAQEKVAGAIRAKAETHLLPEIERTATAVREARDRELAEIRNRVTTPATTRVLDFDALYDDRSGRGRAGFHLPGRDTPQGQALIATVGEEGWAQLEFLNERYSELPALAESTERGAAAARKRKRSQRNREVQREAFGRLVADKDEAIALVADYEANLASIDTRAAAGSEITREVASRIDALEGVERHDALAYMAKVKEWGRVPNAGDWAALPATVRQRWQSHPLVPAINRMYDTRMQFLASVGRRDLSFFDHKVDLADAAAQYKKVAKGELRTRKAAQRRAIAALEKAEIDPDVRRERFDADAAEVLDRPVGTKMEARAYVRALLAPHIDRRAGIVRFATDPPTPKYLQKRLDRLDKFDRASDALRAAQAAAREGEWGVASTILRRSGPKMIRDLNPKLVRNPAMAQIAKAWASAGRHAPTKRAQFDSLMGEITDTYAKMAERFEKRPAPAEFQPIIKHRATERVIGALEDKAYVSETDEGLVAAIDEVEARIDADLLRKGTVTGALTDWTQVEMARTLREVEGTWRDISTQEGINPIFIHHVSPAKIGEIIRPGEIRLNRSISEDQIRKRVLDLAPAIRNIEVALLHAEVDRLQRLHRDTAIARIVDPTDGFGLDLRALQRKLAQEVPERGVEGLGAPELIELAVSQGYYRWDPSSPIPWRTARTTAERVTNRLVDTRRGAPGLNPPEVSTDFRPRITNDVYTNIEGPVVVPKWVGDSLNKIYKQHETDWGGVWDKSMKVFRSSVLALSPRWHTYNIVGGNIMLAGRTDPLATMRYWAEARKIVNEGRVDPRISRGTGTIPRDIAVGDTARSIARGKPESALGRQINNIIEKSYEFNGYIDDMYRTIAYLYAKDKEVAKMAREGIDVGVLDSGVMDDAAKAVNDRASKAGVDLANKILQDWNSMTPLERSVIKSVFPFYGWLRHVLQYSMTYPLDHPYRTSVLTNVAEVWSTQVHDDALPWRFENYIVGGAIPETLAKIPGLGPIMSGVMGGPPGPDPAGRSPAIYVGGFNPFNDLASLVGLGAALVGAEADMGAAVGQMNPGIGGFLTALGVSSATGTAGLFGQQEIDPETGSIRSVSPPLGPSLLGAFIPQLRAAGMAEQYAGLPVKPISSFLGTGTDTRSLMRERPDLARSQFFSALGIPMVPRRMSIAEEEARAEIGRYDVAQRALSEARTSGDYSRAKEYPSLRPYLAVLEELEAEGLIPPLHRPLGGLDPLALLGALPQ